jgi:uncharacterized coiled-coil protein SlyX
MGVYDAPQWLLSAFVRSAKGAGATAPEDRLREVGSDLVERWTGPGRTYHNLRHLTDVLARAQSQQDPDQARKTKR